jgi:hypothetical protein
MAAVERQRWDVCAKPFENFGDRLAKAQPGARDRHPHGPGRASRSCAGYDAARCAQRIEPGDAQRHAPLFGGGLFIVIVRFFGTLRWAVRRVVRKFKCSAVAIVVVSIANGRKRLYCIINFPRASRCTPGWVQAVSCFLLAAPRQGDQCKARKGTPLIHVKTRLREIALHRSLPRKVGKSKNWRSGPSERCLPMRAFASTILALTV